MTPETVADTLCLQNYRKILKKLRKQLEVARPQLILTTPGAKPPPIEIDSDDETVASPDPSPAKARKGNDGRAIAASSHHRPSRAPRVKIEEAVSPSEPLKAVFTLEYLKRVYDSGSAAGLPDQINPKVTGHIIRHCLQGWPRMINTTLKEIKQLMVDMLSKSVQDTLATRRETQLFRDTKQAVRDLFLELLQKQQDLINTVVTSHTHKPIIYAVGVLAQAKEFSGQQLETERSRHRVNEYFDKLDAKLEKIGKQPTKPDERQKKFADAAWIKSTLGTDPYHREISAMVTPVSYYDVVAIQILDNIARHLELGLIDGLEKELKERLFEELKFTDPEHCAQLLAEDPRREKKRLDLIGEKIKLEKAIQELRGLPEVY